MRARWSAALLLCVASAQAAPLPQLPGIGPDPARITVDPMQTPWNMIGRVQTELGVRCSGVAVAPRVIMTAAHCLWLPATSRFIPAHDVHVLMSYRRGRYTVHARALYYRVGTGYDPAADKASPRDDHATIILDRPVVSRDKLLPHAIPHAGQVAALAGYQQDREEVLLADISCHVLAVGENGLIRHDCAGTHGASGGPLLVREPEGWALAGLVILAGAGRGGMAVSLPQ